MPRNASRRRLSAATRAVKRRICPRIARRLKRNALAAEWRGIWPATVPARRKATVREPEEEEEEELDEEEEEVLVAVVPARTTLAATHVASKGTFLAIARTSRSRT